jgi:hypothetical protein
MVPDSLKTAIEVLRASRRIKGPAKHLVRDVLRLLEEAEKQLRGTGAAVRRESKRSGAAVEYAVEQTARGQFLTERRLSGKSQPFRCPKPIYDAVVKVLGASKKSMSMDEIAHEVTALLGESAADFQLRVPLRFWMHVGPPLVVRHRARYKPAEPESFVVRANEAWVESRSPE